VSALDETRRRYADEVCAIAQVTDARLREAFATVPREHFLGAGPWSIAQPFDREHPYRATASADPSEILRDVLVGIDLERQLNNGQPSAHARWMSACMPRPGESVLHVGAGVGYYSAILAELAGRAGRVLAVEADAALAARATGLSRPWPQTTVECSDAASPRGPFDVIYVNAGATRPRDAWLDALSPGGRMLLPLTVHLPFLAEAGAAQHGVGAVFVFTRGELQWSARFVSPVGIFDCIGARDEADERELKRLLDAPAATSVNRLVREPHQRTGACVVHLPGCCLSAQMSSQGVPSFNPS
jgi:protein-L-isoaspartate(D-aspartate) O-methyltransferase